MNEEMSRLAKMGTDTELTSEGAMGSPNSVRISLNSETVNWPLSVIFCADHQVRWVAREIHISEDLYSLSLSKTRNASITSSFVLAWFIVVLLPSLLFAACLCYP